MRRGSIYWVNLGTTHPPEFGKTRPGIVVSNTVQNTVLDSVVIVPLSTQPQEIWPLRIDAGVHAGRLSYAVLPGIRQVSKSRLGDQLAMISDEAMRRIDDALAAYLSE
jgi:mRNA interferase MazF